MLTSRSNTETFFLKKRIKKKKKLLKPRHEIPSTRWWVIFISLLPVAPKFKRDGQLKLLKKRDVICADTNCCQKYYDEKDRR